MSTRPPPPTGRPPVYAVAGRAFGRTNLRSVVIISTITAIIWSLVWAGGAFEDINGDKRNDDLKKLVIFDIVLGTLYMVVAVIELFGLFSAVTRRSPLVRIYVGLSWLVVLLVAAAELVRTVVHFTFKNAILSECVSEATGLRVRTSFGFWGGTTRTLNSDDADEFCHDIWNRNSVSTIAWLILGTIVALFYASIAHSFYRQLLDPTFARAPSDQVRLAALQSGGAPYGGGYVPYPGFNNPQTYAPPAGPPPGFGHSAPPYEGGRLPGYGSEFAPKDVGPEKEKDGDPFMDSQHYGAGPSEAELARPGHRV